MWILTSGNFVSFRQCKYNFFTSENEIVKTFTISFEQFELLYSYQDVFYTILPILKEKKRCIFSHQGQLDAMNCTKCNPIPIDYSDLCVVY